MLRSSHPSVSASGHRPVPTEISDSSKPARERIWDDVLVIRRIIAYADGDNLAASRDFYVEVLGFEVAMEDPVLGLGSPTNPTAQVIIAPRGMEDPRHASGSTLASRRQLMWRTPKPCAANCASCIRSPTSRGAYAASS